MIKNIEISACLDLQDDLVILDVRTPGEFKKGHIPGAMNLPLFSDEERAVVGTIYKQENPEIAFFKGLDFVGPKLSSLVLHARELASSGKIALHCWRGGKRSGSLAWLLNFAGLDVSLISGGYKAYKQFIRKQIVDNPYKFLVLGGKTGSGKTLILKELEKCGEQIIDLEKLARHKGSAFGYLGESTQPTTEHFENLLFKQLSQLDFNKRIWLENESRNIGSVYLPDGFWKQMKAAPLINIEIPLEERVNILVDEYSAFPYEDLMQSFEKIKKRIGGNKLKEASEHLKEKNYHKAAEIALNYYDKSYQFSIRKQ